MLETIEVNGRDYMRLDIAAEIVGYSVQYVEQLARGKWIEASYIQTMYYVDIDSLASFVSLVEADKKEALQAQSRHESAVSILGATNQNTSSADDAWIILSKTGIVTTCGLLVGLLTWTVLESSLQWQDLQSGIMASTGLLLDMWRP